jgi:hypothetical protein
MTPAARLRAMVVTVSRGDARQVRVRASRIIVGSRRATDQKLVPATGRSMVVPPGLNELGKVAVLVDVILGRPLTEPER